MPNRHAPVMSPADPTQDAIDDLSILQTVQAMQLETDTAHAAQASALGMSAKDYLALPAEIRDRILDEPTTLQNFEAKIAEGIADRDAQMASLTGSIFKSRNAGALAEQLRSVEERNHVWLYDPPIGGQHRGKSRTHVTQVREQMRIGFSPTPLAPVTPPGTLTCGYESAIGVKCPKDDFHTTDEILAHQQRRHADWFNRQEMERTRNREDRLAAAMEALAART